MVLLEFAMAPRGSGESVSPYVARMLDIIDRSGLRYQVTAMGTILEGEWDACMAVVTACFRELQQDCNRIGLTMSVDWRAGDESRLQSKVTAVEARLGRKLAT
jgi:uncharacterized protein (TIGR00106 family)